MIYPAWDIRFPRPVEKREGILHPGDWIGVLEKSSDDVPTADKIFETSDMPNDSVSDFRVKCADFNYAEFLTGMLNPVDEHFKGCESRQSNVQCQKPVRQSCDTMCDATNRGDSIEQASKGRVADQGQDAKSGSNAG